MQSYACLIEVMGLCGCRNEIDVVVGGGFECQVSNLGTCFEIDDFADFDLCFLDDIGAFIVGCGVECSVWDDDSSVEFEWCGEYLGMANVCWEFCGCVW